MSIGHDVMSHALDTDEKIFRQRLGSFAIIDIGILESVVKTEKGIFGTFRSSRLGVSNKIMRYTNVELLNIGSSAGGFLTGGDGEDLYLLFCPATPLVSTLTRFIDKTGLPYSLSGMKGIPISSQLTWVSHAGFDRNGNFILTFPDSSLAFNVDSSISYQHQNILKFGKNADGSMYLSISANMHQVFVMADGSWYKVTWANGYVQEIEIHGSDGKLTRRRWSTAALSDADKKNILSYDAFLYEYVENTDGSSTESYFNAGGTVISSVSIDASGKRTVTCNGYDLNAGTGKIKLASTAFNYSSWLQNLISTLQGIGVDPGSHMLLPTVTTQLVSLLSQLQAGTE